MEINMDDVRAQAQWELDILYFDSLVKAEKERIIEERNRKSWFPWRIRLINVNKEK